MSYSIDMRERALKYVFEGGKHAEACKIFGISRKTLYNWLHRESLAPKETRKSFTRKLNKEALVEHVREHPDALLRERAVHFGVRVNSIWVALKKMNISKKNNTLQGEMPSKKDNFSA